jgi:hypothetical protein
MPQDNLRRYVIVFDRATEELVEEIGVLSISTWRLREIFDTESDIFVYSDYAIERSHMAELTCYLEHGSIIDFEKNEYFLSCENTRGQGN